MKKEEKLSLIFIQLNINDLDYIAVRKLILDGFFSTAGSRANSVLDRYIKTFLWSINREDIVNERGIWSAVACYSGYRNKKRKYKDYGVIIKTLPIGTNMKCYMEDQVKSRGPYYLCNPLMSDLILTIVPWKMVRETLHGLALKAAVNWLGKDYRMISHVGGDSDSGAHYYHDRLLDVKLVRDFISGKEHVNRVSLLQEGFRLTKEN